MKTLEQLDKLFLLTNNWDGYGGIPPATETIDSCKFLYERTKTINIPSPEVMVTGDGEVSLFWNLEDVYIEAGFEEDGVFSYIFSIGKGANSRMFGDESQDGCTELFEIKLKKFANSLNKSE